jgi:flagellar motor switch protein FliG
MSAIDNISKQINGVEKAAIILLSMSEEYAAKIFALMNEDEIKDVSSVMSNLGAIKPEIAEKLINDFINDLSNFVSLYGNIDTTEKLLQKVLDKDKVSTIMEDIRGPVGKNTWDKLGNVNEQILASYLKNEYPQTVAVVVSKLSPSYASKVLSALPEDFTLEVMMRMLTMESVKKEVLDRVERTLKSEFIGSISRTQKYDSNQAMAEIFNNFDRVHESKFMGMLENRNPEYANKIKELMFTFDDLQKVSAAGVQTILRYADKGKLAIALKGAAPAISQFFISNMSQRAAKILQDDIASLGPVRMKDVDAAQSELVAIARDLESKGEITLVSNNSEDEMVY